MMITIRCFCIWTSICFILVNVIGGTPIGNLTKDEAERSNLSGAVQLVIIASETQTHSTSTEDRPTTEGSATPVSTTKGSTTVTPQTLQSSTVSNKHEGSSSKKPDVEIASISTQTSQPAKPDAPSPAVIESSPTNPIKVSQLPSDATLFNGLAQNVGTLNIGGIIMEAFKLAQVSIALFGQSLQSQFGQTGGFIIPITNSTRLIGKV